MERTSMIIEINKATVEAHERGHCVWDVKCSNCGTYEQLSEDYPTCCGACGAKTTSGTRLLEI